MKQKIGYMHKKHCLSFCWLAEPDQVPAEPATIKSKICSIRRLPDIGFCLCVLLCPITALHAETPSCTSVNDTSTALPDSPDTDQGKIKISADSTRASSSSNSIFQGNVIIEQHHRRIQTDYAEYNDEQQIVNLKGHVQFNDDSIKLTAQAGQVNMENRDGAFDAVDFSLKKGGLRGHAQNIVTSKDEFSELQHSYITSCPVDDNSWQLDAGKIKLNYKEEYGTANNVVLRFKGVPFFYTPYIEFPTGDRRRSGLLIPTFSDSSSRGFEFTVPWYWNIAPNQDAIIAPHYMNRRGNQLDTQYRFLTESSKGELNVAYLDKDKITDEKRYQLSFREHSNIATGLRLDVDVQDVSDTAYFNDFSTNIANTSSTNLNRSTNLGYTHNGWNANLFAQTFETVDPTIAIANRPYRTLPKLSLDGSQKIGSSPFVFSLNSEWVNFEHEDNTLTTGSRAILKPGFSLPLQGTYWFATPAISYSLTDYNVKDGSGNTLPLEQRRLTSQSLDAGLFFDRPLDNGLLQTLEPRIYYLKVPYVNQSNLPLFDTSIPDFSLASLFRDNRFNGGDRIGDADQATLALTSRFLNPDTGNELVHASLGQIFYFKDRRVTLTGINETRSGSASIAEISANWLHWRSTANVQWDSVARRSQKQNFFLHYQSDEHYTKSTRIFNIGYRMLDDGTVSSNNIEQSDISFIAPVSKDYALFARWNYSIQDKQDIDVIGGLSYDSCCWSIQLLAQRRLNNVTAATKYDNAIMVQLVLKGLGSVSGNSASTTLSQAIPGYTED